MYKRQIVDAGLPEAFPKDQLSAGNFIKPDSDLEIISNLGSCGALISKYTYYFVLYRRYQANNRIFDDYGPVSVIEVDKCPDNIGSDIGTDESPGENGYVTIKNIPKVPSSYAIGSDLRLRVYRNR